MKYLEVRGSIKSGDLVAWSHRPWKTFYDFQIQMVRLATQSEYCHVGTAWVVGGRVFIIEAVTPKVRIFPLSKLLPCYLIKVEKEMTPEAEEFALLQVGMDYSKLQAIQSFFGKPNFDELWQCAELTIEIGKRSGNDFGLEYTPAKLVQNALENDLSLIWLEDTKK